MLTSRWAAERRGRELSLSEAKQIRVEYGPDSGAAAVYDSGIDALVFPTGYRAVDLESVVLHELGHALTVPRAHLWPALIRGLPSRLHQHVYSECYEGGNPYETLRYRVLEALAEGYVYVLDGRIDHLPAALASELMFILQSVEDGERIRFEFEMTPEGERTASRVSWRELVDAADPEEGHLFADMRCASDVPARDLADDEIGTRRLRRRSSA